MNDKKLEWHEVFWDGETVIDAADYLDGVLICIDKTEHQQFLPGYRVKPMQGDMDRARLERR